MEGWPVQATDDELRAAERLADRLTAQGLQVVTDADLCRDPVDGQPIVDAHGMLRILTRAGCTDTRYEPTGETVIADVTQVAGELWVPPYVAALVQVAVQCCPNIMAPDHDLPVMGEAPAARAARQADMARLDQSRRATNVDQLVRFIERRVAHLADPTRRGAALATYRVGGVGALHDYLNWLTDRPAEQPPAP